MSVLTPGVWSLPAADDVTLAVLVSWPPVEEQVGENTCVCLQNVYTGGVQCVQVVHSGTLLGLTVSHLWCGSDRSDPLPLWSLAPGADLG